MGVWCVVPQDHLELKAGHAEVQRRREVTVSLGVFPEKYIDADPKALGVDAVVDELD